MNINIAFNTIIYIMVFLFPGILFRRAFFSGKFNKHFDSGNSFERILWNVLFSIICTYIFSLFINLVNYYSENSLNYLLKLKTQDILNNFVLVYENKFPSILKNTKSLSEVFYILASLYIFSTLLGYFLHKIIFIFGFEKRFSIFKFQNSWDYLTISNRQNNINHKLGDIYYTMVDIKTKENNLFTGKLHDIVFDKDGKIESFTLQETYKFVTLNKSTEINKINEIKLEIENKNPFYIEHIETNNEYIYKKRIKGNIFTIFNQEVENISITYIKISHLYERFQKYLKLFVSTILLLTVIFSISYAIWDYHIISFKTIYKRIGFCIMLPINMIFLILFFVEVFSFGEKDKRLYWIELKDAFLILLFSLIPHLYIFNYIKFYKLIILLFVTIILLSFLLSKKEKGNNQNETDEISIEKD